jgi:hypothetical protein
LTGAGTSASPKKVEERQALAESASTDADRRMWLRSAWELVPVCVTPASRGFDVELGDPSVTTQVRLANPMHRCLGTLAWPVAEAAGQELGFEQRLDHLAGGLLDHPIGNRWDAQRAHAPVGLWDLDPPHRRWDVSLGGEQPPSKGLELVLRVSVEAGDALPIDPGGTSVCPDVPPGAF